MSLLFDQLAETNKRIEQLTGEIEETYEQSETIRRLATIPGVGILSATIIAATTPDVDNFDCARDYAAWLALTPKPHSTGGKQRMGRISKMGNRYTDACCIWAPWRRSCSDVDSSASRDRIGYQAC